jgi:D-alanyl-D-alanine carboxypeptidase
MLLAPAVCDRDAFELDARTVVADNHSKLEHRLRTALLIVMIVPLLECDVEARGANLSQPMIVTTNSSADKKEPVPFYEALTKALKKRKIKLENICPPSDVVARRILEEYGAIYLATKKVTPPPVCIFTHEDQVTRFQEKAGFEAEFMSYDEIELQPEALKQLKKAREEAQKEGLDITPRDGAEAARRNYEDSVRLWNSRFSPALDYWLSQGKLTTEQVARLRALPLSQQIAEVLELEKTGLYFSKDLSKSILYSIAAPGTSQHIAMLAFDVNEFDNPRVREILAKHGWFQTVLSDLPHFTFLGLKEKDLPKNGLRSLEVNGQVFWIPNVAGLAHPGIDK